MATLPYNHGSGPANGEETENDHDIELADNNSKESNDDEAPSKPVIVMAKESKRAHDRKAEV